MILRDITMLSAAILLLSGCGHPADTTSVDSKQPPVVKLPTEAKLPNGWKEISTSGFALSFPPDWKAIDLTQADFDKAGALGNDPKLAPMRDQVKALAAQGIFKVFVFETKSIGTGFANNCNVTVVPLPGGATLEAAAQQTKDQIAKMTTAGTSVDLDYVDLTAGKAARIRSQIGSATPGIQSLAYLIAADSKLYGVTFSSSKADADKMAKVAEQTMNSFRLTH